jgi:hypothetical protein
MTGRGRPPIGTPIEVRLTDTQLARIDAWATAHDIKIRAEAIRRLINISLNENGNSQS